ncbi:DNA replication licensing factor MCM2 [Aphelenchoides fujianensis]|nr:DNA replication licensing factor MCM2 [Aphelenchoides fujianensis]
MSQRDGGDSESIASSAGVSSRPDGSTQGPAGGSQLPQASADARDERDEIAEMFGDELQDYDNEDDGEDLFGDDMERDYRPQPELDVLSASGLDDGTDCRPALVGAAEREMAERDNLMLDDGQLFYEEGDDEPADIRRRRRARQPLEDEEEEEAEDEVGIDILENMRDRTLRDHVRDEAVGREIEKRFKRFLRSFKDANGQSKYINGIKEMAAHNRESIEVEFADLAGDSGEANICYFLPEAPTEVLKRLDNAATAVVKAMFPWYERVAPVISVRIRGLPIEEEIRALQPNPPEHADQDDRRGDRHDGHPASTDDGQIRLRGVSSSFVIGPFFQRQDEETKPTTCPSCQSRGPFKLNVEETIYHNYQRITIQESPNLVAAGRLPRSKDVILTGDLCDACKPGDLIELTGTYTSSYDGSMNNRQGFPVFNTLIFANHIARRDQLETDELTDEDVKMIRELAKDPQIAQRIFASIAPTIYGHENIKQAITLALFRGEAKNPNGKHNIRGDINVLLCGDPGTAKSQFLRYVSHVAPRSVMTTGQGASSVGLTAYVQRHPVTREWTLEAGAMVLADKGVCLIDEFDKMKDTDRTSIHEAMEQQSISVSKAGIVTSLQARCTVIAAANPINGRYDASKTFAQNVELTEPILSRFDILCVVRDTVDPVEDDLLATFVIDNHRRMHPENNANETALDQSAMAVGDASTIAGGSAMPRFDAITGVELIPQATLRKYIAYAREALREQSQKTASVAITIRNVESMIRIAEAHAKLHLRQFVSDDDMGVATRIMLKSFISTQRASVVKTMEKHFHRQLTYKQDINQLLLWTLKNLMKMERTIRTGLLPDGQRAVDVVVKEDDLLQRARRFKINDLQAFYNSRVFKSNRFQYDNQRRTLFRIKRAAKPKFGRQVRLRCVDWMVQVQAAKKFCDETLFLAVKLMDLYFDRARSTPLDPEVIVVVCVLLASKFEERFYVSPHYLLEQIRRPIALKDVYAAEHALLKTIGLDLGAPLACTFLRRYGRLLKASPTTVNLARFVLEVALHIQAFATVRDSQLAAASLLLAFQLRGIEWKAEFAEGIGHDEKALNAMADCLLHLLHCRRSTFSGLTGVMEKYISPKNSEVARVPLLPDRLPTHLPVGPPLKEAE